MFVGMSRDQITCAVLGVAVVIVACGLLQATTEPREVLLCGLAAVCGLSAFVLSWEK